MKTVTFWAFALCVLFNSCVFTDAQVVWLSTKNMDFTDCEREERIVEKFDGIKNTCPFDVIYEQSDRQYVVLEGDEEYFDCLHTDVRNGVLEVTIDPARYRNVSLRVKVGSPVINQIVMSGSGSIVCKSEIVNEGALIVKVLGSGDIVADKTVSGILETSVSGSGDFKVTDIEAGTVNLKVSGSGDWVASNLKAENLTATLVGSGDIKIVNADIDDTISARISGSGDIYVNGYARNAVAKVSGSGDISGHLKYERISKTCNGSGDIDW